MLSRLTGAAIHDRLTRSAASATCGVTGLLGHQVAVFPAYDRQRKSRGELAALQLAAHPSKDSISEKNTRR